jgi:hypothetical protein
MYKDAKLGRELSKKEKCDVYRRMFLIVFRVKRFEKGCATR